LFRIADGLSLNVRLKFLLVKIQGEGHLKEGKMKEESAYFLKKPPVIIITSSSESDVTHHHFDQKNDGKQNGRKVFLYRRIIKKKE
jgi:hypothetical protein